MSTSRLVLVANCCPGNSPLDHPTNSATFSTWCRIPLNQPLTHKFSLCYVLKNKAKLKSSREEGMLFAIESVFFMINDLVVWLCHKQHILNLITNIQSLSLKATFAFIRLESQHSVVLLQAIASPSCQWLCWQHRDRMVWNTGLLSDWIPAYALLSASTQDSANFSLNCQMGFLLHNLKLVIVSVQQ